MRAATVIRGTLKLMCSEENASEFDSVVDSMLDLEIPDEEDEEEEEAEKK